MVQASICPRRTLSGASFAPGGLPCSAKSTPRGSARPSPVPDSHRIGSSARRRGSRLPFLPVSRRQAPRSAAVAAATARQYPRGVSGSRTIASLAAVGLRRVSLHLDERRFPRVSLLEFSCPACRGQSLRRSRCCCSLSRCVGSHTTPSRVQREDHSPADCGSASGQANVTVTLRQSTQLTSNTLAADNHRGREG